MYMYKYSYLNIEYKSFYSLFELICFSVFSFTEIFSTFFLQNGTTALMLATSSKKSETVKLLLSQKADVYQMNKVCIERVII